MFNTYAPCMCIETATPGKKVVYTGDNGTIYDHEQAQKAGLIPGKAYTLFEVEIRDWSTKVYLKEAEGVQFPSGIQMYFNSVIFADVEDWKNHMSS